MKRTLSIVLSVAMVLCLLSSVAFPAAAETEEYYTDGYYTYSLSSEKAIIAEVDTSISGDIVIPSELGGHPVIGIGGYAFYNCDSLTSITLSNNITTIGDYAFCSCAALTGINFPNNIISIGGSAFQGCNSLTSVTIPDSVTSIGGSAFCGCASLTNIALPNNITSISDATFMDCSVLTSITIPDSVTSIGESAFSNCTALKSITLPNTVIRIRDYAFYKCDRLNDVWYIGGEVEKTYINTHYYNTPLLNATWHYNYNLPGNYINVLGATIKTDADMGNQGMRYEIEVGDAKAMADVSEVGILLIPQSYLGSAELTVDTAAAVKLATVRGDSNWDAVLAEGGFQATLLKSTIQGRQNWELVSRAYTVLTNGEVLYGEASVKSVTSVALAIANTAKSNGASTTDEIEILLAKETLSDTEISKVLTFCRENIQYL